MSDETYNASSILFSVITILFTISCVYIVKKDNENNTCYSKVWLNTLVWLMIILNVINILYQSGLIIINKNSA